MKRSITKYFVWIALGAAVVVGVYYGVNWEAGTPRAERAGAASKSASKPSTAQRDTAALREKVAMLERQLWSLTQRFAAAQASWSNVPDTDLQGEPEADAPSPPHPTPLTREQADAQLAQYMNEVDAAFLDEPTDPEWSASTSELIQRALADDAAPGGLMRHVECHSRTCRVEIEDDGSGRLAKSLPMFAHQLGQVLPNVSAEHLDDPDGRTITVLYMSQPN